MIKGKRWHQIQMNRISQDERLHPRSKLLASIIGLVLSSSEEDEVLYKSLLTSEFIDGRGVRWNDAESNDKLDKTVDTLESKKNIIDAIANIVKPKEEIGNASNV